MRSMPHWELVRSVLKTFFCVFPDFQSCPIIRLKEVIGAAVGLVDSLTCPPVWLPTYTSRLGLS